MKTAFPAGARVYGKLREIYFTLRYGDSHMESVFSKIYRDNLWEDPESTSGRGSTLARTEVIRRELSKILGELNARSLLDAACGDFNWMRYVDLGKVHYTGCDVVPDLVKRNQRFYVGPQRRFICLDITRDEIPMADVILCRDCLIHLSFKQALSALANFRRSGSPFLLATTHRTVGKNQDGPAGGWRSLNLQLAPFHFPEPLRWVTEDEASGKCLGLWRLRE